MSSRTFWLLAVLLGSLTLVGCTFSGADRRGELTVINRTVSELTVTDTNQTFSVPACGEASASDFLVNWWQVTAPGSDTFSSGGGFSGHAYLLVIADAAPTESSSHPASLPPCQGNLPPAQR